MTTEGAIPDQEYQAACERIAFYCYPDGGCLTLSGQDRFDFLQRQSTQDIMTVSPQHAATTVLTSPTARILDVLWILSDNDDLIVQTLPGRHEKTSSFLKSKIFFMDKVSVVDVSGDYSRIDLIGPHAEEALAALFVSAPFGVGEVTHASFAGHGDLTVLGLGRWHSHSAFRLGFASSARDMLVQTLEDSGAIRIGAETHEVLRIEAGIPGENGELTEEYTPLEVGLRYAISDSKGCYTGQEVIARQIAYDKVTRNLVSVAFADRLEVGTELWSEGRSVGALTSVGTSPRFGQVGLAVVKRPYTSVGTSLSASESAVVKVAAHPFVK